MKSAAMRKRFQMLLPRQFSCLGLCFLLSLVKKLDSRYVHFRMLNPLMFFGDQLRIAVIGIALFTEFDFFRLWHLGMANRDRRKPRGLPLPHHRTNGSRIRRFDEANSYRGARLGSPICSKKRKGSAIDRAGVCDTRHGPCADLLTFHASRTDTPRLRSSR